MRSGWPAIQSRVASSSDSNPTYSSDAFRDSRIAAARRCGLTRPPNTVSTHIDTESGSGSVSAAVAGSLQRSRCAISAGSASVRWMFWATGEWCSRRADFQDEVAAIRRGAVAHRGERRAHSARQHDVGQVLPPVRVLRTCRAGESVSADEQDAENGEETSAQHTPSRKLGTRVAGRGSSEANR